MNIDHELLAEHMLKKMMGEHIAAMFNPNKSQKSGASAVYRKQQPGDFSSASAQSTDQGL